jgi:hypothetical protein
MNHMPNKRGVKTEAGKAVSSRNAVTHGMTSTLTLINGESQADLDLHLAQWHEQYPATNEISERLVIRAALSEWHLLRLERQYNTASSQLLATPITDWDDSHHILFKNLQRYLTTAQRTHDRDRRNLQQYHTEIQSQELQEKRMENSKTSEAPPKFQRTDLSDPKPPFDWPINQQIRLWRDFDGQSRVDIVPSNEHILANTDDAFETTPVNRHFFLETRDVVPGYEWVVDFVDKMPPDSKGLTYTHTAKSFRIIAEREKGGPAKAWLDLCALDKPILDSKVKGPPCLPRESN